MIHSKTPLGFLILAFAILWLPLGQHHFLHDHWMKLGTFMAPFLLFLTFTVRDNAKPIQSDVMVLSVFMMVFYIIHQCEEHWIDIFGNIYAFQTYLNGTLQRLLGITNPDTTLITKADIFVINTSLVWLVACIAIANAPKNIFPALCMAGIILINSISHSVSALRDFAYNPGLVTSIVIFIPFALWFYRAILKQRLANHKLILWALVWAFVAHIILMAGLVLTNHFMLIPPIGYYAALIIWSVVPAFAFRSQQEEKGI
ncbi:MAG: HXXEE domain-containing protein [Pseudomonadota bacterium]